MNTVVTLSIVMVLVLSQGAAWAGSSYRSSSDQRWKKLQKTQEQTDLRFKDLLREAGNLTNKAVPNCGKSTVIPKATEGR